MDLVFVATSGRRAGDILRLSPALRSELFSLALLAPFVVTNLRAEPGSLIAAVDASSWGTAVVFARARPHVVLELMRHTMTKGTWTKLMSRTDRWLRQHGIEPPEDDDSCDIVRSHFVFDDVARALQFELLTADRTTDGASILEKRELF